MQLKKGGRSHLKLNIAEKPIANKYCEGKLKRILERKLKVPKVVIMEAYKFSRTIYLLYIKFKIIIQLNKLFKNFYFNLFLF